MKAYVSLATKTVVIERTPTVETLFPGATPMGTDKLILPYDQRHYVLLRRLGCSLPNPMVNSYSWPGRHTPFEVQKRTCSMLTANPRAYVLNDMGTGKTYAALASWDYLRGNGYAKKLLVCAPLSTLNFVWGKECFAAVPHRKYQILGSPKGMTKKVRLERLNDPDAEIFIINHDGIKVLFEDLMKMKDIDTLVIDELAVFRNNTDRSLAMRKLAARMDWAWGMTGSPMPNQPTDVWSQCKIITPQTTPKFFREARDSMMTRRAEHIWEPKENAVQTAYAMMQPSVRFNLDDVVELPETVSRVIDVPLSPLQNKIYTTIAKEYIASVGASQITAVNAAAAMSKLLQIACGWVYAQPLGAIALDAEPRHDMLVDLINQAAQKVIVFVPFRHACVGLSKILSDKKINIDHAVVHGDISNRDDIFNLFQNTTKYKVILAHPACMAHGVTLTSASTIIWYCPTTSLETYEQANARIRRVGQKHRQQILHLQSTPVERRIYTLLRAKQKVQDKFLDMFADATSSVSVAA